MRSWAGSALRILFLVVVAYPVAWLWLGIHLRHRERLPRRGPAIVAANHNSHLDILTLLSLFPLSTAGRVQPAAAADYFFRNRWLKWFSLHVIGIIPVVRGGARRGADPLEDCYRALEQGRILVIFPEGTRGEPEQLAQLKTGVWHLARRFPHVPVIPVFMQNLGKSMPKGSPIPLPLFVNVAVGQPLFGSEEKIPFMAALKARLQHLATKVSPTHHHEVE